MKQQHLEDFSEKWSTLLALPAMIPGVVGTVINLGGTRPVWSVERGDSQTMLMAWPEKSLLRAAVVLGGPRGAMEPVTVFPLLEGFANDLTVIETYSWKGGKQGEVLAQPDDEAEPLWFHDPLFFRDIQVDLTVGVTQSFYLAGLCYGLRRALLDEMTISSGAQYEAYAAQWLQENPGKGRLDVPPLLVSLRGLSVLGPMQRCSDYQARGTIRDVDSFLFGPEQAQEKIYRFAITLGVAEHPLHIVMYAPERICNGYEPKEGHEVDLAFWLQGRIVDVFEEAEAGTE